MKEIVVDGEGKRYSPLLTQVSAVTKEAPVVSVHKVGVYVISGGLGSLGMLAAQWLVKQGATNVVLLSRRKGYSVTNQEEGWGWLKDYSATVIAYQCDVSNLSDVNRCIKDVVSASAPLRGIIHSAGVLDDALIENQTVEKLRTSMGSKAHAAWNLHTATLGITTLDMFVLYSSVASVLGTASQGNYAAANAYLDALAQYRRGLGLCAVSIQWGPWDTGMATRGANADGAKFIRLAGMKPIESDVGMAMFGDLIRTELSQVAVIHINWTKFVDTVGNNPLLVNLIEVVVSKDKSELEVDCV